MEEKLFDLWVTQAYSSDTLPHIDHYKAVKYAKGGVAHVMKRGHKVRILQAAGRHFWTDRDELMDYLKRCAVHAKKCHENALVLIAERMTVGNWVIISVPPEQKPEGKLKL